MISPNQAKITFRGNEVNTLDQTYEYVMKHAAEVTLKHGYDYFEVVSHDTRMVPDFRPGIAAHTVAVPASEAVITFVKNKTARSYDARKVSTL